MMEKKKHARIIIKGGAVKKKKILDSLGASLYHQNESFLVRSIDCLRVLVYEVHTAGILSLRSSSERKGRQRMEFPEILLNI